MVADGFCPECLEHASDRRRSTAERRLRNQFCCWSRRLSKRLRDADTEDVADADRTTSEVRTAKGSARDDNSLIQIRSTHCSTLVAIRLELPSEGDLDITGDAALAEDPNGSPFARSTRRRLRRRPRPSVQ